MEVIHSHTKPSDIKMPTKPNTSIIFSQIHKDHWFGITNDIKAYECNWFIPDQPKSVQFNHILSEIIVNGGSVRIINRDMEFGRVRLTCGGVSLIDPSRPANHKHETGLTLRLEGLDIKRRELNILIAGDQRYDFISKAQLSDLNILIACHHGGDCCQSNKGYVPVASSVLSSTVIYSYGKNNTYKHPKPEVKKAYKLANWKYEHHTTNGDYMIIISL